MASLYREVGEYGSQVNGHFSYLRRDLLDRYLTQSGKAMVWLIWGERGFHHRSAEAHNLREYYANHQHIHKHTHVYQTASSTLAQAESGEGTPPFSAAAEVCARHGIDVGLLQKSKPPTSALGPSGHSVVSPL